MQFLIWKSIIRKHTHTKSICYLYYKLPYFPCANNTNRFTMQIKSQKPIDREIIITCSSMCNMDFSDKRQKKPYREFSDSIGRIGWNSHNCQILFFACLQVNIVKSRTSQSNDFYSLFYENLNFFFFNYIVHKNTNCLVSLQSL